MTINNELERKDIAICADMEVDCESQQIIVGLETWFDVDRKFGKDINSDDDAWLNLYAIYYPYSDTLKMMYEVSRSDGNEMYVYEPTDSETKLVKEMIAEKIKELHNQTPQEFCEEFYAEEQTVGEIK